MTLDPPRYQWTGARFEERRQPAPVEVPAIWVDCWQCSGQGREFMQTDFGDWRYRTCVRCFGVGSTLVTA